ncbi:RNA polymerase subunit sigma-24 [Cohnella sp. CIP 111063]|uniref:DUF1835 domain-containing protein n=1 Tax=unclassified Cohnella TaxID=2636738 RepID=UPI000B8C0D48|nr:MULTISPECIES: DUF1835 domain-containing protein [unclassified Cohnella]OXS57638.1 RNA polymerase subunit sigma-24 [Cohnella sp. CIP 111063]PRX71021.1 uncharacterized protein DUF1835 [Cohnella sp. SGD-V74]
MLHIVNGDHVGDSLRRGGIQGDVLVWRELYTEGPIFADPRHEARTAYMTEALGIPPDHWKAGLAEQTLAFEQATEHEEIVLWFEHDLFDQTMLIRLLHEFERRPLGRTRLSLVCIGEYPGFEPFHGLGQLLPEQLIPLADARHEIQPEELRLGSEAWEAYASADPRSLADFLRQDTEALPYLRSAFRIHLARYPSVRNGLGIVEQATLEALRDGVDAPLELFRLVSDRLSLLGMGDLQYWLYLAGMIQGQHPLIAVQPIVRFPTFAAMSPEFQHARIRLTDTGAKALKGEEDRITLNGIDLWLGGVHLYGSKEVWRWDESSETLERK